MCKRLLRLGFVMMLLGSASWPAHLVAGEQVSTLSVVSAKEWIGLWFLKVDGARGKQESTLSIKDAGGKVAATLRRGPDDSIEVMDVSSTGNDLILKYKQKGPYGQVVNAVTTLSMRRGRTAKILSALGTTTESGTAKKVTVSEDFVNELLYESDQSLMFKKARAAGLVVKRQVFGRDSAFVITDPATGIELLHGRTTVD